MFSRRALAFISSVPRLILVKGLGHLLLLSYPVYFACLLPFCCLNQKNSLNIYLSVCAAFPYPVSLINTFCSSWDRYSYLSKSYNCSPRLVGYQESFIGAVNGRGIPTKPINLSAINELFWRRCRECSAIGK